MNGPKQFGGQAMARRVSAVLDHDGIPARGRASFLAHLAGVSTSTARRVLAGKASGAMRPAVLFALADGLGVEAEWLGFGELWRLSPRTMRMHFAALGYGPDDAARAVRLLIALRADNPRAVSLWRRVEAGSLDVVSAARLL